MFHFPASRFRNLWIQLRMTGHYSSRVAPFGYLRINARVQLPEAFRSLPRPSSPADLSITSFQMQPFFLQISFKTFSLIVNQPADLSPQHQSLDR